MTGIPGVAAVVPRSGAWRASVTSPPDAALAAPAQLPTLAAGIRDRPARCRLSRPTGRTRLRGRYAEPTEQRPAVRSACPRAVPAERPAVLRLPPLLQLDLCQLPGEQPAADDLPEAAAAGARDWPARAAAPQCTV